MSFLQFHALDWDALERTLGSRDRKLEEQLVRRFEPEWSEQFPVKAFAGGPTWERGIHHWLFLPWEARDRERGATLVEELGYALGFVGIVTHLGKLLGSMQHTVSGGTMFREDFMTRALSRWLGGDLPLTHLLDRPLLGWRRSAFPSWGGLTRAEVETAAARLEQPGRPEMPNGDLEEWADELLDLMLATRETHRDLVTLYLD